MDGIAREKRLNHPAGPEEGLKDSAGGILARVLRWVDATLRYRVHVPGETARVLRSGGPVLLVFAPGRGLLMPFICRRQASTAGRSVAVAGLNGGPDLAEEIAACLGVTPLRASGRGGQTKALGNARDWLRAGGVLAVLADGAGSGSGAESVDAIWRIAMETGTPIVPVSWSARPRWRAWSGDRLYIPVPFARVAVRFGKPLLGARRPEDVSRTNGLGRSLSTRLNHLGNRADTEVREARAAGWIFWGYNLLLFSVSLIALPYLLWQVTSKEKYRVGFFHRLGLGPVPEAGNGIPGDRPLWIHGVSVGEVLATVPLVERLRNVSPEVRIVVSAITQAGQSMARERFTNGEQVTCFPFDYPMSVRRVLRRIAPRLFVHTESEIWPNFLLMLGRRGIPSAIVNGRISARSCRRFERVRFFTRRVLGTVRVFAMQSREDCYRIIRMGADPSRVYLTGNMKFDVPAPEDAGSSRGVEALRAGLGFGVDEHELVFVAGSTHEGEDEIVLDAYMALKDRIAGLKMLLAPRHLERCRAVEGLCLERGLSVRLRTGMKQAGRPVEGWDVLVLDTIGELARAYAVADVVFVGGSLVPIGGHNPLEPILYRKPVLIGPHTYKITWIVRALVDAGGGIVVAGKEDLVREAGRLLEDDAYRESMGRAAHGILQAHRGAADRNLAILRPLLYADGSGLACLGGRQGWPSAW